MHVYKCACRHVCMYACMRVCTYACMHVRIDACVHVCMGACRHVCMCACVHVCMYASVQVCMCACMHVCMYACLHVGMYACRHVCIWIWRSQLIWAPLFEENPCLALPGPVSGRKLTEKYEKQVWKGDCFDLSVGLISYRSCKLYRNRNDRYSIFACGDIWTWANQISHCQTRICSCSQSPYPSPHQRMDLWWPKEWLANLLFLFTFPGIMESVCSVYFSVSMIQTSFFCFALFPYCAMRTWIQLISFVYVVSTVSLHFVFANFVNFV